MCLDWCCIKVKELSPPVCDAKIITFRYDGKIIIEPVLNETSKLSIPTRQLVELFDLNLAQLYPYQIEECNELYEGIIVRIRYMDMIYILSNQDLPDIRLCDIIVNGNQLSNQIRTRILV